MPTKKVAAAPAKKAAAKTKAAPKKVEKKTLVCAADGESFWTTDGKILNSLVALADALGAMEKAAFAHHVSKDKNDFATWVEDVLCDAACAADLRKATTPSAARTVVVRHLKLYRL